MSLPSHSGNFGFKHYYLLMSLTDKCGSVSVCWLVGLTHMMASSLPLPLRACLQEPLGWGWTRGQRTLERPVSAGREWEGGEGVGGWVRLREGRVRRVGEGRMGRGLGKKRKGRLKGWMAWHQLLAIRTWGITYNLIGSSVQLGPINSNDLSSIIANHHPPATPFRPSRSCLFSQLITIIRSWSMKHVALTANTDHRSTTPLWGRSVRVYDTGLSNMPTYITWRRN